MISNRCESISSINSPEISFFADPSSVASSSILNQKVSPPATPDKHKGAARAKVAGEWERPLVVNGKVADLPVTFHNRIKSSGYGRQDLDRIPRKTTKMEKSGGQVKKSSSYEARRGSGVKIRLYDLNSGPTTVHQKENDMPPESYPMYGICYNTDGSMLSFAAASPIVSTFRLPISKHRGDGVSYMGHDSRVLSCSFSNDKESVLSSSDDGTVRVWRNRPDAPVLVLSHYLKSPITTDGLPSRLQTLKSLRNKPFGAPIKFAGFFFLDRLIALCVRNSLILYTYDVDKSRNDLKRSLATGKYSKVYDAHHEGSQAVTAAAFMNTVQSTLLITSTSDKKLCVVDASAGKFAAVLEMPHDKPVHCIALPSPSVYTSLPSNSYTMFCTASIDNSLMLWDLRSSRCSGRFSGHVNRREEVGCALSPCLRYLACGSEDRSARVIDLRMLRELARLQGHKDVVSGIAYNPLFSQLATCSFDGSMRFYIDPNCPTAQMSFV